MKVGTFLRSLVERLPGSWQMRDGTGFAVGVTPTASLPTCNAQREGEERRSKGSGAEPSHKYVCEWDGAAYAWTQVTPPTGGGSGSPGGANTYIQYNDGGNFGGDPGLVFNETTDVVRVGDGTTSPQVEVNADVAGTAAFELLREGTLEWALRSDASGDLAIYSEEQVFDALRLSGADGTVEFTGNAIFSVGGTPADTGTLRIKNNGTLHSRNGADDGNLLLISANGGDSIRVGDGNAVSVILGAPLDATTTLETDDPYDATTWDGSLELPSKNAIRDEIESLSRDVRFNVRNYGAVGDDSTDDTAAFDAAVADAIAAGGGVVYVPAGIYKLTGDTDIAVAAEEHITIEGDGRYQSVLRYAASTTGGLNFVSSTVVSNYLPTFTVRNLSLRTSMAGAGTAISATWAIADNIAASLTVEDVEIVQDISRAADLGAGGFGYWTKGIYASNARNATIRNLHMYGERDGGVKTTHGIHLDDETTRAFISQVLIFEVQYGILIDGTSEGCYLSQVDVVAADYGVYADIAAGAEPQLTYIGGHIAAFVRGIYLNNYQQSTLAGLVIYASNFLGASSPDPWKGIEVAGANSAYLNIHHCVISKESGRNNVVETAIHINDGDYINLNDLIIFGLNLDEIDVGVLVEAAATNVLLDGLNTQRVTSPLATATSTTQWNYNTGSGPNFSGTTAQEVAVTGTTSATYRMQDSGAGANLKNAKLVMDGGVLTVVLQNDDLTTKNTPISISAAGALTLSTDLALTEGGTGASTAAGAIANLGLDADIATLSLPAGTTISATGASIIDDASTAAVLTTLGVDTDLQTFSVPASTTISAFGKTLVDDADEAAARDTLGLIAGDAGDIWVEKAGDIMTGQLDVQLSSATAAVPLRISNPNTTNTLNRTVAAMFRAADTAATAKDAAQLLVVPIDTNWTASSLGLYYRQSDALVEGLTLTSAATVFNETGANTDVRIEGDTDANLLFIDAGVDSVAIGNAAPTSWFDLKAGTTARAPLRIPSGTNLTTPIAGAVEYDGASRYYTTDTTSNRQRDVTVNEFRLAANAGAGIGAAIADFFGTNNALSLAASALYEFEAVCYFTKTTAGTVLWTLTASSAPTAMTIGFEGPGTAITVTNMGATTGLTTAATGVSGTLSTGVNFMHMVTGFIETNAATNIRLRITSSAGTVTPLRNSVYRVRRVSSGNAGSFVA